MTTLQEGSESNESTTTNNEIEMQPLHVVQQHNNNAPTSATTRIRSAEISVGFGRISLAVKTAVSTVLAYIATTWRFWCLFFRWPITYVMVNFIAMVVIFNQYNYWGNYNNDERVLAERVAMGLLWFGLLAIVDSIVLYAAAKHVETQVESTSHEQDNHNQETSSASDHHPTDHHHGTNETVITRDSENFWEPVQVHGKTSQMIDKVFAQQSHPKVSFLVCLLFCLCGFLASVATVLLTGSCYYHIMLRTSKCFQAQPTNSMQDMMPRNDEKSNIEGIPSHLQSWAKQTSTYYENVNFVNLEADKITFFVANSGLRDGGQDDSTVSLMRPTSMLVASSDGKTTTYPEIGYPHGFVEIKAREETLGFCCEYKNSPYQKGGLYHHHQDMGLRNIFCYYNGATHKLVWTPTSLFSSQVTKSVHPFWLSGLEMKWVEEDANMWLRQVVFVGGRDDIAIAKLDIQTMQVTDVAIVNQRMNFSELELEMLGDNCYETFAYLLAFVGIVSSSLFSYWLLKIHALPSGLSPLCSMIIVVLNSLVYNRPLFILTLCVLAMMVGVALLLGRPKKFVHDHREIILWCLYTSLMTLCVLTFLNDGAFIYGNLGIFFLEISVTVFIGIMLNHPIIQSLGVLGLLASIWVFIMALCYAQLYTLMGVVPMMIFISAGTIRAGYYCSKYRPHLVAYGKAGLRNVMTVVHQQSGRMIHEHDETSELVSRA